MSDGILGTDKIFMFIETLDSKKNSHTLNFLIKIHNIIIEKGMVL